MRGAERSRSKKKLGEKDLVCREKRGGMEAREEKSGKENESKQQLS